MIYCQSMLGASRRLNDGSVISMASRKDSRNRVLKTGETQRENGTYQYRYIDPATGKRVSIYAPSLQELREKEKEIHKMLDLKLDTLQGNRLLGDQLGIYLETKLNLSTGSKKTYQTAAKTVKQYVISKTKLRSITPTQVKQTCIEWFKQGYSHDYINICYSLVRGALQMAYEDGYIQRNPCSFHLSSVLPDDDEESNSRPALTKEEKENLLQMVAKSTNPYDEFYYHVVVILCETGLRIGEFRALRDNDVNFKGGFINVHHQLTREGEYTRPKSKNAVRKIPMTQSVIESMRYLIDRAKTIRAKKQMTYAGIDNFIMLSKRNGLPVSNSAYSRAFARFEQEYKTVYEQEIIVSPHICRHTFCTNCVSGGLPLPSLPKLMGHGHISTSLGIYTDLEFQTVQEDFSKAAANF